MNRLEHRSARRAARQLRLTPLALSLVCLGLAPALAQNLPTGFVPVTDGVALGANPPANTLNINQSTARAIANWQTFNIASGHTVNVNQPSSASVLLSRVVGINQPSTIAGALSAKGHVYLVNPSGVLFSKGSQVNVGGLIASTLDMTTSNADFMAGSKQLVFERADTNVATVVNEGTITTTSPGGVVALMGAEVRNVGTLTDGAITDGIINVARGSAGLISARRVTVDFEGDGLTKFTIPADSQATAALVENSGSITADGGRIALLAASTAKAQVVNMSGSLRARTLEERDGEIVLGAGLGIDATNLNSMRLAGSIDATGGEAGIGGQVSVTAGEIVLDGQVTMAADRIVVIDGIGVGSSGSGQTSAGGGQWIVRSGQDITVSSLPPFQPNSNAATTPMDAGSVINAGVLGRALSRSTDVVLESAARQALSESGAPVSTGVGVTFDATAQVVKDAGGDATLTVNSARNIIMAANAELLASSGALNVDFNADALGAPLPTVISIADDQRLGGAIRLTNADIHTNGGSIRFFGQSDPVNGRAIGSAVPGGETLAHGVSVTFSDLNTCAVGSAGGCEGSGQILLRGQGTTRTIGDFGTVSGAGVLLDTTDLRTGSGAITADGRGGMAASGVQMDRDEGATTLVSDSGDITVLGSSRGWFTGDRLVLPITSESGVLGSDNWGGGSGVRLVGTQLSTGGSIRVEGQGADLSQYFADPNLSTLVLNNMSGGAAGNSATVGPSHGVLLNLAQLTAGAGRSIDVRGQAGSPGWSLTIAAAEGPPIINPNAVASLGVGIAALTGQGFLRAPGGAMRIDGRGSDVVVFANDDVEEPVGNRMLDVSSGTGAGGSVAITGANITVRNFGAVQPDFINASGATGGGSIDILGSGSIAIDQNVGMQANTTGSSGNGGRIRVVAQGDLRTHGSYSARAGTAGGNGGFVETSGDNVSLTGIRVDASAPVGAAGTWLIDPFDINIVDGAGSGGLPINPFEALANSTIQDGDINATLNGGTSVAVGTGVLNANSALGNITFDRLVDINLDTGKAPVTFKLDAARSIVSTFGDTTIRASSAPLSVEFNAGLSGISGSINYGSSIQTNGGSVTMTALGNGSSSCGICMNNALIDTRGPAAGGNVSLTVPAPGTNVAGFTTVAISLGSTDIFTSTGDVTISGFSQSGTGVQIAGTLFIGEGRLGIIETTSGDITVTGVGAFSSNSADAPGNGVTISNARLGTVDGNIAVRGLRQAGAQPGTGVSLTNGAQLIASGAGDIEVTGEALGAGPGVLLTAALTNAQGQQFPTSKIDGNRHVVLRASNDGSTDALVLNGTVRAGQVLNLRPGGVDAATGAGVDRIANTISLLGGPGAAGFAVSADEMSRLTASTVVVGSNTHAGNIDVLASMASAVPLTLQNGGGGNINLLAPVSAPQLGLISGGNITQAAGAAISAGTLLAQSFGGNVILSDPGNNVSASTLGGGAAGRFEFVNSAALRVGPVSVTGFDAAGNLPQVQAASSMAADTVLVRTLSGELILATNVSSTNGADLVAATTFQNAGGSLSGAPWRVWADTWVGETRGGLVGSGQFPNLYHCAYLGLCTVTVSPGDNHFIYAQQPTATVTIGSFSRASGQANPAFTFTLGGLILGDTGVGITGTPGSEAGPQSAAGRYPIFGTFNSAEGYAINVVPGELLVTAASKPLPEPARFIDVLRDEPTTYVYDRNMGQAPICLATGPLDGDRAQQGNDLLAREWSRVRTRPNLTSCLDTERHNGCSDF